MKSKYRYFLHKQDIPELKPDHRHRREEKKIPKIIQYPDEMRNTMLIKILFFLWKKIKQKFAKNIMLQFIRLCSLAVAFFFSVSAEGWFRKFFVSNIIFQWFFNGLWMKATELTG